MDECENLARAGLRTLAFAIKYIPQRDYNEWKKTYDKAISSL